MSRTATSKATKGQILKAASDLFLEGGAKALSVRAIATKAGVSTIGIYSHFQGKQGILDALYIEGFEKIASAMDVAPDTLSPHDAILETARAYLETAESNKAHYRLIFGDFGEDFSPSQEAKETGAQAFNALVRRVSTFLEGETETRCKEAALQLWALVHGFVSLKLHSVGEPVDVANWRNLVIEAVKTHIRSLKTTS